MLYPSTCRIRTYGTLYVVCLSTVPCNISVRNGVAAYNRDVMRYERSLTCVNYGYVYVCGTVLSDDVASITLSKS